MYDADFNTEGFGAPPAAPYGVHGMDRSDTNDPSAFPGNVTAADTYPTQLTSDVAISGGPVATYGAADTFADPNPGGQGYVYSVDAATGAITIVKAPAGRYTGPVQKGTPAYNAIYSLYLAQRKSRAAGAIQSAASTLASALSTPSAAPLDLSAYSAASLARMEAARAAQTAPVVPTAATPDAPRFVPPSAPASQQTGMGWTTWAVLLGGVALAYYFYTKNAKK